MTYKGSEYYSDTDGKDIKLMQERNVARTIKLKEGRKFQMENKNQKLTQNNEGGN